jgi:transient receptor potential cation channel subfamily M protein 2
MLNWKLPRPGLIISVTGGAKKFKLPSGYTSAIKKGIIKAALSTEAWLVTGGTEEGIMKHMGESASEMEYTLDPNRKLILLGIANWSTIRNNHLLTKNVYKTQNLDYLKQ